MQLENCVFCKIAKGDFESAKVWEDNEFLAFLDLNPNTKGMTLVIPKEHYGSDFTEIDDPILCDLMTTAKNVGKMLKKALNVERVALVVEGLGVDHVHVKLYPLFDLSEGYITTELGPQKELSELKSLAEEIKEKSK